MLRGLIVTTILASAVTACAVDENPVVEDDTAPLRAPIRSAIGLASYLGENPSSPLNRMSAESKRSFVESLVFSEKGLASYRYAELRAELTPVEIEKVLGLFGEDGNAVLTPTPGSVSSYDGILEPGTTMDPGGSADHEGYKCESAGTCVKATNYICTSNC
jgi:hypothetical protein